MSGGELTADQIRALLHELGRRLQARGIHGDIKLVGGAALILQGIGNRPTADIDASYADPATVNAVVTEMAEDYDLAPDWLNSNAAAFVPDNATWVNLEQLDGLTIQAADTETLLAMKIAAERDKDTLDIAGSFAGSTSPTPTTPSTSPIRNTATTPSPSPQAGTTTSSSSTTPSTQPQPSNTTNNFPDQPSRKCLNPARVWITIADIERSSRPRPLSERKPFLPRRHP
ncbi:hypothetical protein AHiyo8_08940 [Arthrobacter sp. Hiyo8]|nr:hypothetical protein AHiyo8_08940 [Arthrobacter sp. Hiyo8]